VKRVHLLRVEREASEFAALIAAVGDDGGRVGWLDLRPAEPPPSLVGAAELGVLRAVAAGSQSTVTVKPRRGRLVLNDLLREHFRGCRVVLVSGGSSEAATEVAAPLLEPAEDGWLVHGKGDPRSYTTDALVAALRKPRPWPDPASDG
jgi:hypothetical protein